MPAARAFVVTGGRQAGLETVEILPPGPGEVLVRMVASGVCATDAHVVEGSSRPPFLPVVLGHEGAGVVEELGSGVTGVGSGDHVLIARSSPCGVCRQCLRGLAHACNARAHSASLFGIRPDGSTRVRLGDQQAYPLYGGTLCELANVRADMVIPISKDVSLHEVCLLGCAVATGIGAVTNVARVGFGDVVLVVGCGGVGLNVVQGARLAGAAAIIGVDPAPHQRELALQLGATHVIDAASGWREEVASLEPSGVDVAFEVVGRTDLVQECLAATRVGGTTVMVGLPPMTASVQVPVGTLVHDRRLVGCRGGSTGPGDLLAMVEMVRTGRLELAPLIGRRRPLDEVPDAIRDLTAGVGGRTVVDLDAIRLET